jgi:hypothetical protein
MFFLLVNLQRVKIGSFFLKPSTNSSNNLEISIPFHKPLCWSLYISYHILACFLFAEAALWSGIMYSPHLLCCIPNERNVKHLAMPEHNTMKQECLCLIQDNFPILCLTYFSTLCAWLESWFLLSVWPRWTRENISNIEGSWDSGSLSGSVGKTEPQIRSWGRNSVI